MLCGGCKYPGRDLAVVCVALVYSLEWRTVSTLQLEGPGTVGLGALTMCSATIVGVLPAPMRLQG